MSNQNWNCRYILQPHKWIVDEDQSDTGTSGVRVRCANCPQVDTCYAPYARQYLENARQVVAEAL